MNKVPTVNEMILRFIDKGITDPTFAPVHLTARLSAVDARGLRTDLARAGESLWNGSAYHSRMKSDIHSYPVLDLSKFPWTGLESVTFASVRDGTLHSDMQDQINNALAALPFQMRPVEDPRDSWRNAFTGNEPLNRYFYFELFRQEEVPEWITGLDKLRMSVSWEVFLPNPSPERDLIFKISELRRTKEDLAKLAAVPIDSITAKETAASRLQSEIGEALRQIAA
jgi:hypothetical protein